MAVASFTFTPVLSILTEYTARMFPYSVSTHVAFLWGAFGLGFLSSVFTNAQFQHEAVSENLLVLLVFFLLAFFLSIIPLKLLPTEETGQGTRYGLLKTLGLIYRSRVTFMVACLIFSLQCLYIDIGNLLSIVPYGDVQYIFSKGSIPLSCVAFGALCGVIIKFFGPKVSIGFVSMVFPSALSLGLYFFALFEDFFSVFFLSFLFAGTVLSVQMPVTFSQMLKAIQEAHPNESNLAITRSISMVFSLLFHIITPIWLISSSSYEKSMWKYGNFQVLCFYLFYLFPRPFTIILGLIYLCVGRK